MKYANHYGWSDVNPFEVVKVVSDKCLEVRAMDAEKDLNFKLEFITGGFCGVIVNQNEQEWIIESNENNPVKRIRLHKNGIWKSKFGEKFYLSDKPKKYYDYNF